MIRLVKFAAAMILLSLVGLSALFAPELLNPAQRGTFFRGFHSLPNNVWSAEHWYAHFFDACSSTDFSNGWTCVQGIGGSFAGGSGTSFTMTLPGTATAGNIILVGDSACNNSACSTNGSFSFNAPTGSAISGGTCTEDGAGEQNTAGHIRLDGHFCTAAAGTQVTVNCSATCWYAGAFAVELIPPTSTTISWDGNGVVGNGSGTSASITKSVTATNSLLYGNIQNVTVAVTPGASFNEITETATGAEHEGRTGVSGSTSCSWSWSGSHSWDGYCNALLATATGGASAKTLPSMGVGP